MFRNLKTYKLNRQHNFRIVQGSLVMLSVDIDVVEAVNETFK